MRLEHSRSPSRPSTGGALSRGGELWAALKRLAFCRRPGQAVPLFELYKGRDPRTTNFTRNNGPAPRHSRSDKQFSRIGFRPMGFNKNNNSETWSHLQDGQHSSGNDGTEQDWVDAAAGRLKSDIPLRDGITVTKTVDVTEEPA